MKAVLLLCVAACNQVYDLAPTQVRDAAFFDAPADAPFGCPPLGVAPVLARDLEQYLIANCRQYSQTRNGRASASCFVGNGISAVWEGVGGEPLIETNIRSTSLAFIDAPRLTHDGSRMLVTKFDFNTNESIALFYARGSDPSTWMPLAPPPFGIEIATLSTMATGPTGSHVLVLDFAGVIREWVLEGETWRNLRAHTESELGVKAELITMTADGLRLLIGRSSGPAMYTDRDSIGLPFRRAVELVGAPARTAGYMTEDCGRVYHGAIGSVFFQQQR